MTLPTLPTEPPDWFRARVRTAAQAAGGFLLALLVRYLGERFGITLSPEVNASLRDLVDLVALVAGTVLWMMLVKALTALHPAFERLHIMKGTPTYPDASKPPPTLPT